MVGLGARGRRVHARGQAGPRGRSSRATSGSTSTSRSRASRRAFAELDVPEPQLSTRPARRAERGGRRRPRLDRPARPRGPRARQEPARPRPPAPRRPRPGARRRRAPRRRGRGRRRPARRPGRRRGRHPVRRRHEHLGQPRGARRRGAHGRLARPRPPGPGARDRRRPRAWRACRPACSARTSRSSSTPTAGPSGHFPDSFTHSTLGGWIATRSSGMQSDRYGDIADLTRGAARRHAGRARSSRARCPSTSTGPSVREMVLGSEGRLGHHHRGDGPRAARARSSASSSATCCPTGRARSRRCARSRPARPRRRSRACPTPHETRVLLRHPQGAVARSTRSSRKALQTYLERRRGFDPEHDVPVVHRLRGLGAPVAAQRKAVGRIVARHGGLCIGASPGELYDQKKFDTPYIRDFLLDRGALGDVSETAAPWGALPRLYDNVDGRRARGAFARPRRPRLRDVPPVALLPLGRVPVLHVRVQAVGRARPARGVRRRQVARSSRRSSTTARRSRTTTRSVRSTRSGSSRTSPRRAWRWCARSSTASTPAGTSTPARSCDRKPRGSIPGRRRGETAP